MKMVILNSVHGNMLSSEDLAYASHLVPLERVKELAAAGQLEFQLAPNREDWMWDINRAFGFDIPIRPKAKNGRNAFLQFHDGDKCFLIEKKSSFEPFNYRFYEVTFFVNRREKGFLGSLRKRFAS